MSAAMRRHCEQLVDLIIDLGGEPRPRPCDVSTAHLHYQGLSYVLPQLIQAHEKLIRQYADARAKLARSPRAAELVARILAEHEPDLHSLRELAAQGQVVAQ
jgi:hypothetical protein